MHFQFELFPLSEHSSPLRDHFASLAFPSVVASRTHHYHHHSILHLKEVIIMIAEKKKRLGIGSPEAKSANGSSAARRGHWGGATHPPCRGHHHHHHHHHRHHHRHHHHHHHHHHRHHLYHHIKSNLEVTNNTGLVILVVVLVPVLILMITGKFICVLVHISCMSTLLCTFWVPVTHLAPLLWLFWPLSSYFSLSSVINREGDWVVVPHLSSILDQSWDVWKESENVNLSSYKSRPRRSKRSGKAPKWLGLGAVLSALYNLYNTKMHYDVYNNTVDCTPSVSCSVWWLYNELQNCTF